MIISSKQSEIIIAVLVLSLDQRRQSRNNPYEMRESGSEKAHSWWNNHRARNVARTNMA